MTQTPTQTTKNQPQSSWNSTDWKKRFEVVRQMRAIAFERQEVFHSTIDIVKAGSYITESGIEVQLQLNADALKDNVFCERPITLLHTQRDYSTSVSVRKLDCLDLAHELLEQDPTDNLCVLNMASAGNPGGGVARGAGAQEEYLFRCSDYYRFLYQYACHFDCRSYGIEPNQRHSYPMRGDHAGIFSHGVTVFRSNEANGYALLEHPWRVNFVAVAAHCLHGHPAQIPTEMIPSTLDRIRTIFRIAYNNGQRRLVLGAFGCGAFSNPPSHMAQLFKQVIEEPEFEGLFQAIHFAIIEDHNSRNANFKAFNDVFATKEA